MKTKLLKLALLAVLGTASTAFAATNSANLGVSAAVPKYCTITTTAVAFGNYDPIGTNASTALDVAGAVNVQCTKNSGSVWIGLGLGANASGAVRRLTDGTDFLTYELYQPDAATHASGCTAYSTVWGNTLATGVAPAAAVFTGASRQFDVCGRIPAGQNTVGVGNYTDTVVATVNF